MSEVKRYRYLLDEAVMESVGSNPSYRTAEGPAWMDADEVTTRIAELEAENRELRELLAHKSDHCPECGCRVNEDDTQND